MHASLTTCASSAPLMPGVRRAIETRSTSSPTGRPLVWTRRIAVRPSRSGAGTWICRSSRPGRVRAGSRTSARFVAASTMMRWAVSKPSIWSSIAMRVFSRSLSAPLTDPLPRVRPMASISSMKTMAEPAARALSNRSRTRLAPTPAKVSTKSDPARAKNGTPASPATARASSVLPVPGGPTSSAPRGGLAPTRVKRSPSRRNSTSSCISVSASSAPATSAKRVLGHLADLAAAAAAELADAAGEPTGLRHVEQEADDQHHRHQGEQERAVPDARSRPTRPGCGRRPRSGRRSACRSTRAGTGPGSGCRLRPSCG